MTEYNIENIETLPFREAIRSRIAMYLGSADMSGVYNAIQEIISNSIDEYYMGYGKRIDIILQDNNCITITDYARGIPFGIKEDGSNVLVDIFSKPHTGGKFNDKVYNSVVGLNGIGGKATCLSSLIFRVSSCRDGVMAVANFEKGELLSYNEVKTADKNGTSVYFIPDPAVYNLEPINIEFEELCERCQNLSYLTKGLTFNLTYVKNKEQQENRVYCAKNGLVDLIKNKSLNPIHPNPIYYELEEGDIKVEIALQWTKEKEKSYTFTNGIHNIEGGTSLTGFKTSITRNLNKLFNTSLSGELARTGLIYAVFCKIPNPSFANQTKTKINNPELRQIVDRAFTEAINRFKVFHDDDLKKIEEFLRREEKAESEANKARDAVINYEKRITESKKKKIKMPDKFKDCEKHGNDSLLIIAEGNSAVAGLMPARNVNYEALYGIRGKIINLLKNPIEECLENQEVSDIILALGCGIQEKYNSKKLNFGKVAIAVDADPDGKNILCLLVTLFYVLTPKFIEEGRLCWLRAPLYRLTKGDKRVFAYSKKELLELQKKYPGWEQGYNKGIGEMSAKDMENSMMNEKERRLEVLTIKDAEEAYSSLLMLMGPDILPRKEFLFKNVDFKKLYEEV